MYVLFAIVLFNFLISYASNQYDNDRDFCKKTIASRVNYNKIDPKLSLVKTISDFPTNYILDTLLQSGGYSELVYILNSMDSSQVQGFEYQFVNILTDSLFNKLKLSYISYNPNRLINDIIWAERLKDFGEVDTKNERLFSAISMYWFNIVSTNLDKQSSFNTKIKFKHSFQHLVARCSQNDYKPNIHTNNFEKTIRYVTEQKWFYMWNRFRDGTSLIYKSVVFLFVSIILFGFYCTYLFIKSKL